MHINNPPTDINNKHFPAQMFRASVRIDICNLLTLHNNSTPQRTQDQHRLQKNFLYRYETPVSLPLQTLQLQLNPVCDKNV